jgi:hypothetical protein
MPKDHAHAGTVGGVGVVVSLRFLTVSQPADLNALNANIQLNNGRLSFRLKRYCSVGTTLYSSPFNGISFPGSRVGNTTYFDLSPSYVPLAADTTAAYRKIGILTRGYGACLIAQANHHVTDVRPECVVHGRRVCVQCRLCRQRPHLHALLWQQRVRRQHYVHGRV